MMNKREVTWILCHIADVRLLRWDVSAGHPVQQVRLLSSCYANRLFFRLEGWQYVNKLSLALACKLLSHQIFTRFAICNHARCKVSCQTGLLTLLSYFVWRGGFVTNRFALICGVQMLLGHTLATTYTT